MSTEDMLKNSMTGSVTLKVSLSAALQNSLGKKPHRCNSPPATIVKNTGSVAFRLKIRFCTAISPILSDKILPPAPAFDKRKKSARQGQKRRNCALTK